MGYPMTYRRVVNRNGLHVGGYEHQGGGTDLITVNPEALPSWATPELMRAKGRWRLLLGDLRRLESDSLDEHACQQIADKVGCDPDTVAGVLSTWFAL